MANGIHNGERTHIQDQFICPHNLRIIKARVNNAPNPIPEDFVEAIFLFFR